MIGNSGANTIDGKGGNDYIEGRAGNDTDVVDSTGDVVTELANEGTDTVLSSVTHTLAANVENLTLTGAAVINGTGNALSNILMGNAAGNELNGGTGSDTMVGGAGDDVYYVDNANDVVIESAGEGNWDAIYTTVNRTLELNVEQAVALGAANIVGNERTNYMYAVAGAEVNRFEGGFGNDYYYYLQANDIVVETIDGGFDYVGLLGDVALTNYTNIEAAILEGTGNTNATGNNLANSLIGNSGANTIDGKGGNDYMEGRGGNDTFLLARGHGADTIYENESRVGDADVAQYDATVDKDQLWFRQLGNSLEVSVIGTTDKVTIADWYVGSQYHIEQFKTSDGKTLLDSQVQNLVSAMAAFAPPAAGQTTLPANYATALAPVLAANWV